MRQFRDDQGYVHEVEVRGEKTKEGIRFSWKDVKNLFGMDNDNVRHMLDQAEYDIFCSAKPVDCTGLAEQNNRGQQTSTYLTYNGLLKIIFASRSGTAYRFQDWASNIIYSAHLGTTEERLGVAAAVVDTDVESMRMYFEEQLRLKDEEYQHREQMKDEEYQHREQMKDEEYQHQNK